MTHPDDGGHPETAAIMALVETYAAQNALYEEARCGEPVGERAVLESRIRALIAQARGGAAG
jgi:hypothetical protein